MTLGSVLRTGAVLLSIALVSLGCSSGNNEKKSESSASSSTASSDFEVFESALDSAGWVEESEFDWSAVSSSGSQTPEVQAALPLMSSWVEASVFSDEANNATSTRGLVDGLQKVVGSSEFDRFSAEYDGDRDDGLENAAAYGLVISPNVELSTEARVAVSTDVDQAEDGLSDAVIEMTARAAIPMTKGSISRWGVYVYNLKFTVPKGYESGGDQGNGISVATMSPGLLTCDWENTFSADVADDGLYVPSFVRKAIEFAGPRENFSYAELKKGLGEPPDLSKVCDS